MRAFCTFLAMTLLITGCGSTLLAADGIEKQLLEQAPKILTELKTRGYKNVGVLKFRVKKGNEQATDRVGPLNVRLAEKLELALILANKINEPIGIVRNASQTAATIPGATHLSAEGRDKLFTKEYPLAWGDTSAVPDAFLTGVAVITADLRTMIVAAAVFDRKSTELTPVAKFEVVPDLDDLIDSGESFSVRGVFDQASLKLTADDRKQKASDEALIASASIKSETETQTKPTSSKLHPLAPGNTESLVTLDILYDDKPQAIEFRNGGAFVAEPREGQSIGFVVRRKGSDRSRLGVVLKVNGENTLNRQKSPDAQCLKWVFEPTLTEFGVYGYQLDDNTSQQFRVLSQAESQAREMDYGEFVGTIAISVFREETAPPVPSPTLLADDGEDFAILTRGAFPPKTPANLGALKAQLSQIASRGLIAEGTRVDLKVDNVKFKSDSLPIMSATIRYYHPQDLPK